MAFEYLHVLPLALFVIFPATFLLTYIAAVLQNHVEPDFPYISDAATYSPESCVFGQFINMGAFLLAAVVYIRYRQVEEYCNHYVIFSSVLKYNQTGLWIGLLSCLGLSLVANFQETNVLYVHFTGAFLCFGCGTVYFWIQAISSYFLHPMANSIYIAHVRLVLVMICTVFFIVLSVAGIMSHLQFHGKDPRKWYPEDGGWGMHVVSTASEWVVATAFCFFILSFADEFRVITIDRPPVTLCHDRSENSDYLPVIDSTPNVDPPVTVQFSGEDANA